ncbi:hypothetical protein JCM8097_009028 [Rhodosporidiobolus ruineniae]
MAAPLPASRRNSWDAEGEDPTPVVSPAPSAAVSRTPTLVDLPSLNAAVAGSSKEDKSMSKEDGEGEKKHDQHLHLPHPHLHLPPHPHQHLEQYYPPENYESTDAIEREKEEARRAAADGSEGGDCEKGVSAAAAGHGEDNYPDGGLRAWLVVAGAWCCSFTAWGYPNSFGVIISYTKTHQLSNYPTSSLAWIGAFQLFANLFFGLLSGKAFDAGYVTHLLVAGLLCYTAGLFGLSYASTYWQFFLAQGLACGIASGLIFLPACSAVSHYFKKRRMLALGVLATGSSLGGVLYPSAMNKLLYTVGFGWTFRAVGFINLGLLAFACFAIRARLPPRPSGKLVDFSVFRGDPGFTLYVAGASIVWLGLYTPLFYSEEFALFHGVSEDIAFYSLSILNAASLFGRIIPNYFADQYGVLTLLVPFTIVDGILLFCWIPAMRNAAGVVIWSILFGFFQGSFVAMLPASIAALSADKMDRIGIRMAMAFLCQSITALVGTPIAGYIISLHPGQVGFSMSAVYSGLVVLVGVALIAMSRHVTSKNRGTPWV